MTQLFQRRLACALACALALVFVPMALSHCGAPPLTIPSRVEVAARRLPDNVAGAYRPTFPAERALFEGEHGLVVAFPPIASSAAMAGASMTPVPVPLVLMLHGVCGVPTGGCRALGAAGRHDSWLVCPGGNVRCGGAYDWQGDGEEKARHIDAATDEVRERWPALVAAPGDDVLVGFSRGAFVARDVAYARPGRYKGLVLIGAALTPDPQRLLDNGVRRVVLASGDFDGARPTMLRAAAILKRGGVETRFTSTGRLWHQLPHDLDEQLAPHIAWIRAG